MGYWYNGYYSGLLIRQIRVQIPGSPLTPHRTNGSGHHILSVEMRVRLPLGCSGRGSGHQTAWAVIRPR